MELCNTQLIHYCYYVIIMMLVKPAWNGSAGQFGLGFLDANLLEINENGFVDVQHKSWPIVANGITADWRLFDIGLYASLARFGFGILCKLL